MLLIGRRTFQAVSGAGQLQAALPDIYSVQKFCSHHCVVQIPVELDI